MSEAQKPLSQAGKRNWDRIFKKVKCRFLDEGGYACHHAINDSRVCTQEKCPHKTGHPAPPKQG